jgi:hypothetical protein
MSTSTGPTNGEDADREYSELMAQLQELAPELVRRLDEVVGLRLGVAEVAQPDPNFDETGFVVLCLNRRGGVVAFGPYGQSEAHDVAMFAMKLVPTWMIDLVGDKRDPHQPEPHISRYGTDDSGLYVELPERTDLNPTRAGRDS